MQLSYGKLLALGLALLQTSIAAPSSLEETALAKRTVDYLPPGDTFINCPTGDKPPHDTYRYSRAQIEKAIQAGTNLTPFKPDRPGMLISERKIVVHG